ncbi:MAG: 50S ribosomal protein L2, partial [Flavobacteriales bacterium]
MAVKKLRPITPGQRFKVVSEFDRLNKDKKPEKRLIVPYKKSGGRNKLGKMTVRYRGGGHKKKYRKIDFKRDKFNIPATVKSLEYDPVRSARIALLFYKDGEKRYILAPQGIEEGDEIMSGEKASPELGNALPLYNIPLGTVIHNIELTPGKGGQMVRSAGAYAQLNAIDGKYAII